jgi:hypothetical protein
MRKMIEMIMFVWQLPQHLLALALKAVWRADYKSLYAGKNVYWIKPPGIGVSLGNFIFASENLSFIDVDHEIGHSRQSELLGPLYLLIAGLPSVIMNLISRASAKFAAGYYNRFPENWADRLGGVVR